MGRKEHARTKVQISTSQLSRRQRSQAWDLYGWFRRLCAYSRDPKEATWWSSLRSAMVHLYNHTFWSMTEDSFPRLQRPWWSVYHRHRDGRTSQTFANYACYLSLLHVFHLWSVFLGSFTIMCFCNFGPHRIRSLLPQKLIRCIFRHSFRSWGHRATCPKAWMLTKLLKSVPIQVF